MKKIFSFLLILSVLIAHFPSLSSARTPTPSCPAQAAILMEQKECKVLFSKNEALQMSPASTTKIMTALVVIENCSPDETVLVPKEAVGTEGSSAYLRAGERLTVLELLYCLMLRSANDAAVALAYHVAGSVSAFADMMNDKAQALGLTNCHFENPHGLDLPNHRVSALDLARLTAYCLENPLFCTIVSTKSISIGKGESLRLLTNHNRLLNSLEGCIGVKTGYTLQSGRCLVSACKRGETVLICVTLNCRPDWQTHEALYDYGFSICNRITFLGFQEDLPVAGSSLRVHVSSDSYSLLTSPGDSLTFVPLCPHMLFAPLFAGQQIGRVNVLLNGTVIDIIPITVREDVHRVAAPGFLSKLLSFVLSLFDNS